MAYKCVVCSRDYKRIEHLQRHLLSHTGSRPFRCESCCTNFARADVLKRHRRTCRAASSNLPKPLTKRRACDRCVVQKRACDLDRPCRICKNGGYVCSRTSNEDNLSTFSRANTSESVLQRDHPRAQTPPYWSPSQYCDTSLEFSRQEWTFTDFIDLSVPEVSNSSWNEMFDLPLSTTSLPYCEGLYSFHFLENFTKTHNAHGLVSSFDCGTSVERTDVLAYAMSMEHLVDPLNSSGAPAAVETSVVAHTTGLNRSISLSDPLTVKTLSIIDRLKEVTVAKPRNSAVTLDWSTTLEQLSLNFFSPTNLRRYFELYWAIWHPNVNILHKPTFEPRRSKSILLAAMAIIGACVSPLPSDNEAAKIWFDCVEEMTFCDDALCGHTKPEDFASNNFATTAGKEQVQALQAAYLVCLFQNWEGSDTSKRRIRRYRYSTLIAVARDIGIGNAIQNNLNQQRLGDFDWHAFVTREELIRCFLWIFLMDTAFVIFNNHPPRMMVKEMKLAMASPEDCFQAESAELCYQNIQAWLSSESNAPDSSLYSLTRTFCNGNLAPKNHGELSRLGFLNLFVIVSALHSLIFQFQNSLTGESQLFPIRNALANWKASWIFLSERQPLDSCEQPQPAKDMWRRVGFSRYASEYWLLASLILGRISESGHESSVTIVDDYSNRIRSETDATTTNEHLLHKYDETSMQQINELIRDLQKVDIT